MEALPSAAPISRRRCSMDVLGVLPLTCAWAYDASFRRGASRGEAFSRRESLAKEISNAEACTTRGFGGIHVVGQLGGARPVRHGGVRARLAVVRQGRHRAAADLFCHY